MIDDNMWRSWYEINGNRRAGAGDLEAVAEVWAGRGVDRPDVRRHRGEVPVSNSMWSSWYKTKAPVSTRSG